MKSIKKFLYLSICVLLGTMMTACSNEDCHLNLSGNCLIEEITIDGYKGIINTSDYTIDIQIPKDKVMDQVIVNTLKLSAGATSNIVPGQTVLNLSVPRSIEVRNGNLVQVWTVRAKVMYTIITKFMLGGVVGDIDEANSIITIYLPEGSDVSSLVPSFECSEGASVENSDAPADFTSDRQYIVRNGSEERAYTIKVVLFDKPQCIFIGETENPEDMTGEDAEAYAWMKVNVPMTGYTTLKKIADGTQSLDGVKLIFWHLVKDNGAIDGHDPFMAYVAEAVGSNNDMDVLNSTIFDKMKSFREAGGAMLLTRYAAILPPFIGTCINAEGGWSDTWATPNNCWQARSESDPEICGGPWDFAIYGDNLSHPLYQNLVGGGSKVVKCTDEGYGVTNSVVCYNHSEGWSEYSGDNGFNHWNERVQGRILGVNNEGDGNIIAWEFKSAVSGEYGKGGILCLGTGCYDWYATKTNDSYREHYHKNIAIMTSNAVNYLLGK